MAYRKTQKLQRTHNIREIVTLFLRIMHAALAFCIIKTGLRNTFDVGHLEVIEVPMALMTVLRKMSV